MTLPRHTPFGMLYGVLLAVLMARVATATGQDSSQWTTNYYLVTGATLPEIRRSINEARPWKDRENMDALTKWRVHWRFTVGHSASGCYCNTFATTTTIAITLPKWVAPTNTSESVKATWARYIAALGKHEAGHAQIGLSAAAELRQRSRTFGTLPDCESLKARINDIGEQVVQDFQRRDKEYDERTRHGATEGAFLPGGGRGRVRPSR